MSKVKPWVHGPLELLRHAEGHLKAGTDFDKRMALISYDNSIETAIITFLQLHPMQRKGKKEFQKADVDRWLRNYHTKLEFFEGYVNELGLHMEITRDEIIWYHGLRNELYHSGNGLVPEEHHIYGIREAALWVFSVLFEVEPKDLVSQDVTSPSPIKQDEKENLSGEMSFLDSFIELRSDLNMLLQAIGLKDPQNTSQADMREAWNLFISQSGDFPKTTHGETIRRAAAVRDTILKGVPIQQTDKDLHSLSEELENVSKFVETRIEQVLLSRFIALGYTIIDSKDVLPGDSPSERQSYTDVLLLERLHKALLRINPGITTKAIYETISKITELQGDKLVENNYLFHKLLCTGVDVSYQGGKVCKKVQLIDFENPSNNDWVVANEFEVHGKNRIRFDMVLFVNGLPLAVIEVKDQRKLAVVGFHQLQAYQQQIPNLFVYNELLVVFNGVNMHLGSLTDDWHSFRSWYKKKEPDVSEIQLNEIFAPQYFLDIIRNFIVFHVVGEKYTKRIATEYQYQIVNNAIAATSQAVSGYDHQRIGIIQQTQGSGISMSLFFYVAKLFKQSIITNPNIIILTDRIELENQLFQLFCSYEEILSQKPVQVESVKQLLSFLRTDNPKILFSTIQKIAVEPHILSERTNIMVIAHDIKSGSYVRHLSNAFPNATFILFTGVPIEPDSDLARVFGNRIIYTYDFRHALEDGNVVPIYIEKRTSNLGVSDPNWDQVKQEFDEIAEGHKEINKQNWSKLETVVSSQERLRLLAQDIVSHFESRWATQKGKGLITTISRQTAINLYEEIINLRPQWHSDEDKKGVVKVVFTSSPNDPPQWSRFSKEQLGILLNRFKDNDDPLKLVIVVEMWLTGIDLPLLNTIYVDKPMNQHSFLQAVAKVSRVSKDKQDGVIVDYWGLSDKFAEALKTYNDSGLVSFR